MYIWKKHIDELFIKLHNINKLYVLLTYNNFKIDKLSEINLISLFNKDKVNTKIF